MPKEFTPIQFQATLRAPGGKDKGAGWTFLRLPEEASSRLWSRGMVAVEGTFQGVPFAAVLEPDGEGGHWLRLDAELSRGAKVGDTVTLVVAPATVEPEPDVPEGLRTELDRATDLARETWSAITPAARRDWVSWIVSAKKPETRAKRTAVAVDKLSKGDRRPCCFDRSGMYGKGLSCPVADEG